MRVENILDDRPLFSVEENQTVYEVAQLMADLSVGAILVLDDGKLCGIFSERDLMTRVIVAGRDPKTTPVEEVMSRDLATVETSADLNEAMELMQRHKCRHLPALRNGRVVGLLSMRDLMNVELQQKTEELEHMRQYIQSA
jgi:signal-transduction protein with cAMP-binding, CBS, and nucleotidyltransferase domain